MGGAAYMNWVSVPANLDNLIAEKRIPPVVAVVVGGSTEDLTCSPAYADFLAKERTVDAEDLSRYGQTFANRYRRIKPGRARIHVRRCDASVCVRESAFAVRIVLVEAGQRNPKANG
jgi:hypothetical protein